MSGEVEAGRASAVRDCVGEPAGLAHRFVAFAIDALLMAPVVVFQLGVSELVLDAVQGFLFPQRITLISFIIRLAAELFMLALGAIFPDFIVQAFTMFFHSLFLSSIVALIFWPVWLYFVLFETSRLGATPGKIVLGLVVVDAGGRHLSFNQATVRWLAKFLAIPTLFLSFARAEGSPRKQALHDSIAGTFVVQRVGSVAPDEEPDAGVLVPAAVKGAKSVAAKGRPLVVPPADLPNLTYASFASRFAALGFDVVAAMMAFLCTALLSHLLEKSLGLLSLPFMVVDAFVSGRDGVSEVYSILEWSSFIGPGILAVWFYFAGMESSRYSATLGKVIFGICVADRYGRRLSLRKATVRNVAKLLGAPLLVSFLIAAFTPRKQALHDVIAGTLVLDCGRVD